jgi:hypothetical protein
VIFGEYVRMQALGAHTVERILVAFLFSSMLSVANAAAQQVTISTPRDGE